MMRMVLTFAAMPLLTGGASAAVVIDRIAVIAGKHAIKASDIDRDIRLTQFLNREPLAENAKTKKQAAERLIDQQVIRDEVATGNYGRASDADAAAMLQKIRQDQYGGSEARLKQALAHYGVTEDQLRSHLLWQLTVLRFIDRRFRAGVLVTDEDIRAYYDRHSDLHKASFESVAPRIRTTLEGEQVNQQFETWLDGARKRERIEYREEALK
jgi:peptidyl-prolyl cis-trans isomerase SurA